MKLHNPWMYNYPSKLSISGDKVVTGVFFLEIDLSELEGKLSNLKRTVQLKDIKTDELNAEYDFFKSLCYALGYNADFNACAIVNMPGYNDGKDFMLDLTREELITLVNNRRTKIHEQLNSIQHGSTSSNKS